MNLNLRRVIGNISEFAFTDYGSCSRCSRTWNICTPHVTSYLRDTYGCFCLCEECWSELSIEERLPHYNKLFLRWKSYGDQDCHGMQWLEVWGRIQSAVKNGE